MAKKDKDLLFRDLSARLPYHVRCKIWTKSGMVEEGVLDLKHNYGDVLRDAFLCKKIIDIKPYLRSIPSMTEEERQEFYDICTTIAADKNHFIMEGCIDSNYMLEKFDWLNKHHFNYRLPNNMFIEAPEGMYN